MTYQRVEVLSGSERRRSYTDEEKARLVGAVFRPGVVVAEAARRLGVHERCGMGLGKDGGLGVRAPG